jgi:hypothetical protein
MTSFPVPKALFGHIYYFTKLRFHQKSKNGGWMSKLGERIVFSALLHPRFGFFTPVSVRFLATSFGPIGAERLGPNAR